MPEYGRNGLDIDLGRSQHGGRAVAQVVEPYRRQVGPALYHPEDQQTVASSRDGLSATLTAGGRTFTLKRVSRSSWPGIAKTTSPAYSIEAVHMWKRQADNQAGKRAPSLKQLLDETGTPILYRGRRHFGRVAGGYMKFPGQRWLRFPVRALGGQTPS